MAFPKSFPNYIAGSFIFDECKPGLVDLENDTIALLSVGHTKKWIKLNWENWNHLSFRGINTCDVPIDEAMSILSLAK